MYVIFYQGYPISRIEMRPSEAGQGNAIYFFSDAHDPIVFEFIEYCYSLISFLSLSGFEALCFEIKYIESLEEFVC